jgi:2-keto-4-pentenoate hydratase/2-oxohepta-3-ene-1,7-dioic acid hydratase in catechol pathway
MAQSLLRHDVSVKILCIGLNYADHARETGAELPTEPMLFGKFPNALLRPGEPIVLPPEATHVDAEAELAVEIGRAGRRISADDALEFVAGYRCANDVSARNLQYADGQWLRAKSFDTFCPLGAVLVPVGELGEASGLRVVQRLNGDVLQDGTTSDLVFGVRRLVAHASSVFTLEPGDLILTGTPAGVGYARTPRVTLRDGDVVSVEIEGIGSLTNPVRAEGPPARPVAGTARGGS